MISTKIKLIWDFRGPNSSETAKHHAIHLKEYILQQNLDPDITGHTDFSSMHSMAFMVVEESKMPSVRDALIPHRGEIYSAE